MNLTNNVGQIDESPATVVVPAAPLGSDGEESFIEIVLPFPVAGLPAGTPIGTNPGPVTL